MVDALITMLDWLDVDASRGYFNYLHKGCHNAIASPLAKTEKDLLYVSTYSGSIYPVSVPVSQPLICRE